MNIKFVTERTNIQLQCCFKSLKKRLSSKGKFQLKFTTTFDQKTTLNK